MKLLYLILRDLSILKDSAHTGKSAPLPATPVDHSPGTSRSPARNTGTGYSTAPIPHPATAPHTAGRGRLPGPVPISANLRVEPSEECDASVPR